MAFRGIDIRQSGDRVIFRASLKDSTGAKLTSGGTTLRLFELQSDGTLKSYDFSSNTFKTTALTTATASMTHRTGNNGTYSTGLWTYALITVSGFTRGNVYLSQISNTGASPADQERQFQYGDGEGDATVTAAGAVPVATLANDSITAAALATDAVAGIRNDLERTGGGIYNTNAAATAAANDAAAIIDTLGTPLDTIAADISNVAGGSGASAGELVDAMTTAGFAKIPNVQIEVTIPGVA